jgi:hypothetical protein
MSWKHWFRGWPVFVEKKGPGRGWWGPPKGTHGPGKDGDGEKEIREVESRILAHIHFRESGYVFDASGKRIMEKDADEKTPYELHWSDDEMAKMKDTTLTHNHPATGGSFSASDVVFAGQADLAEIRAVGTGPGATGKTFVYRLSRPEKGWGLSEQVKDQINRVDNDVRDHLWSQVKKGSIRPEQAEFTHNHEVMKALASANNWDYTRREL